MNESLLSTLVQQALTAIETGQSVDAESVALGLSTLFDRPATPEEVEAAITQLRLIPTFLSMEERLELVLSTLANSSPERPFLQEQHQSVDALFQAARDGQPLSLTVRHDFGVLSHHHEACLIAAIRNQQLTRAQALSCIQDGVRLTQLLSEVNRVALPLEFRTTDHNGMPQVTHSRANLHFDETVTIETPGHAFSIAIGNESELRQVAIPEPDTLSWLDTTLRPDSVLYDVGANIGYYSLYAAALRPGSRVIAFEPAPLNVSRLNHNIHLNHQGGAIMAFPIALSDQTGVVRFGNSYLVSGGWSHRGIDDRKASSEDTFYTGCIAYTLDEFLQSTPFLPFPTHLKIDVDGPELKVLRGALKTLSDRRLRHLLIEMREDPEVIEAENRLTELGFQRIGPRFSGLGNRLFVREG